MIKNSIRTIAAFLIGSLIGAGAMLLTAPRSGGETRELLRENVDGTVEQVEASLERIRTQAAQLTEETRKLVEEQRGNLENNVKDVKKVLSNA